MWNQAFFSLPSETKFSLQFKISLPKRKWGRTLIRIQLLFENVWSLVVGSLKMNTALEYSTRVVQEGDRRCKKSTLNDLAYLTPLRIPLMNPVYTYQSILLLILLSFCGPTPTATTSLLRILWHRLLSPKSAPHHSPPPASPPPLTSVDLCFTWIRNHGYVRREEILVG